MGVEPHACMEHISWEEKLQKQNAITYEKERIRRKIKKLKSVGRIEVHLRIKRLHCKFIKLMERAVLLARDVLCT